MKDLDFDELDRAVSSLMTPADTPSVAPEENLAEANPTPEAPTPPAPVVAPLPAPAPVAEPVSLATRRSGRFMDVVHPSSDMKTSSMSIPSRQGITIAPRSTAPSVEQPSPVIAPPQTTDSPAPTDTSGDLQTGDEPTLPEPGSLDTPAALTSPFLPYMKVEKRPLGGQNIDSAMAAELSSESPESAPIAEETVAPPEPAPSTPWQEETPPNATDDVQSPIDEPKDVKVVLPVELSSDLVAIEAGESTATIAVEKVVAEKAAQTKVAPSSFAVGSIPQQYAEQPSTGDDTHTPIYDTEEVHQALAHPAKKKSGWLWVIWILVILAIGAGAGAAVFFFYLV